jgi:hypothetical protein
MPQLADAPGRLEERGADRPDALPSADRAPQVASEQIQVGRRLGLFIADVVLRECQ